MATQERGFLSISNLTKSYGAGEARTQVLKGISTEVDKGIGRAHV